MTLKGLSHDGASFWITPGVGTGYLRPLLNHHHPKEKTMFDPSLVQVAIHAALDVCWPILHPESIEELAYV